MTLLPLEFKDCLSDSPYFREKLQSHEKELDRTSQAIKSLIKELKELMVAAKNLSRAQRSLSRNLLRFKFECIGNSLTDDEIVIGSSLKEFAKIIDLVEDERERMLERSYVQIVEPLENFRKEAIGGAKEGRKKFEKQTHKFYQSQERYLNLSTKKDGHILQEADASLEMEQRHFVQASLQYVFLLQEVQERKKFEFVETLLGHMYSWLVFYHQGHEVFNDWNPYMKDLQIRVQRTRDNFLATRQEAVTLKNKMLEKSLDPGGMDKMYTRQGYLFLMEKKAFATTWTKHYCQYRKESKIFTMIPYNQITQKITTTETIRLKSCVRRMSDTIDKRFCFDLTAQDKPGIVYTLQCLSDEDRRGWMDAMDGKEPTYLQPGASSLVPKEETILDSCGLQFISKAIAVLEGRGLEDQGLYRLVGVSSKVSKLLTMGLDRTKCEKITLDDTGEWEVKTITSAIKQYFRNLPEPIMTYNLHSAFINAAKQDKLQNRVDDIHRLVHGLPKTNYTLLKTVVQHLCNVSNKSDKNLMTVSNLGVCFGPTLLRPEEESVAAIMDIKFCNIVIEILIEHFDTIFKSKPKPVCESTRDSDTSVASNLSTPKCSPPPSSHTSHQSSSSVMHHGSSASSKNLQPFLQTVVTSYTTSEPQVAHYSGPNASSSLPPNNLLRSDATSNLRSSGHPQSHPINMYANVPPPPSATHLWSVSSSNTSLNSGLNSHASLTSLTSGTGNHYESMSTLSLASNSTAIANNNTNNNNNNNSNTHSISNSRPGRPPPPNGLLQRSTPVPPGHALSFLNPLSTNDRGDGGLASTSSSSESLSSRSSREHPLGTREPPQGLSMTTSASPQTSKRLFSNMTGSIITNSCGGVVAPPPPHHPAHGAHLHNGAGPTYRDHRHTNDLYSFNGPSSSARIGSGYPPTYRQHLETLCKRQSMEYLYSSMSSVSSADRNPLGPLVSGTCNPLSSPLSISNGNTTNSPLIHNKKVRTLYACVGENESELSFEPNQILTNVRSSKEPGWLEGTLDGRTGLVPENYVEYVDEALPSHTTNPPPPIQRNTDV